MCEGIPKPLEEAEAAAASERSTARSAEEPEPADMGGSGAEQQELEGGGILHTGTEGHVGVSSTLLTPGAQGGERQELEGGKVELRVVSEGLGTGGAAGSDAEAEPPGAKNVEQKSDAGGSVLLPEYQPLTSQDVENWRGNQSPVYNGKGWYYRESSPEPGSF